MRTYTQPKGWYSDITLEGDRTSLIRDIHITVNGNIINLPGENVLFLVCKRYNSKILLAGQGHQSGICWFYDGDGWVKLGVTFATFPCAFGPSELYFVSGPNQYRIYDLESKVVSGPIGKALGSQGIRYFDITQSPDGLVTGDATYGPAPFNLSQWIRRDNLVLGQSFDDGGLGLIIGENYHKWVKGSCEFIRFYRRGDNLAFVAIDQPNNYASFFWMTLDEFRLFPVVPNGDSLPVPEVIKTREPGPINMSQKEILKKLRLNYPTPLGQKHAQFLLESAAALSSGAGLLRKTGGTFITLPDGTTVAQDIICYPDGSIFDFLRDGEGDAEVVWNLAEGSPVDSARYYKVVSFPKPTEPPTDKPEPEVIIKEVIKEVVKEVIRPRVKYEEMMQFVSKVNHTFADTKLGKFMDNPPEEMLAHILWRYLFEHESYSDDKLLEEVRLRGNEEWRD